MRLTDIRTTRLAVPLSRVFRGGTYEITTRCTVITEVITDTNMTGCTYAGDERTRQPDIVHIIESRLKPLLIERTGGNPFFLEESVRTLVETRMLVGTSGAYRLAQALPAIQVPATVQAVLAARMDRLPAEDKILLQTAAVIGKCL
jgi:hypothetical protein